MKHLIIIATLFTMSFAQRPEIPEWEVHGLTSSEWAKIGSLGIPITRIDSVTSIGVTLSEYLMQPWVVYEVTFKTWYKLRRSGKSEDHTRRTIEKRKWKYRKAPDHRTFSKGIED